MEENTQQTSEVAPAPNKKSNKNIVLYTLMVVALLCSIGALGFSIYNYMEENNVQLISSGTDGNSANFTEGSIADVASKVSPSVVSITTETRTYGYFGQESTSTAAGTGMIVTSDGYVLTNKHVIEDASEVNIVLDDGTSYDEIELVGTDPTNDIAFLKIKDAENLPAVTLGDSKTLNVGQQVLAIGNALGQFSNSVTEGIISGTGRSIVASDSSSSSYESLTDMIQTDASINAGNSGGPLVNAAGEVIGVNTAVYSSGNGIGFAIPISGVKGMLNNIIKNSSATRAYLGVQYVTLTPDTAKSYNLDVSTGAYVYAGKNSSAVISGSPADKAGIKDGDIITKINGVEVGTAGTVGTLVGEYMPGDTITVTILRDSEEKTVKVKLAEYPTTNADN